MAGDQETMAQLLAQIRTLSAQVGQMQTQLDAQSVRNTIEQDAQVPNPRLREGSVEAMRDLAALPRLQTIPPLHVRLSDGHQDTITARSWMVLCKRTLIEYDRWFVTEDRKLSWVFQQTEGIARRFLEPSFVRATEDNLSAVEMVDKVYTFLHNPHDRDQARDEFTALRMSSSEAFWDFYHRFQTVAATAEITDDYDLRCELRNKIVPRLRIAAAGWWDLCRTLQAYVNKLQTLDLAQAAERTIHSKGKIAATAPTSRSQEYASRQGPSRPVASSSAPSVAPQSEYPLSPQPAMPRPSSERYRNNTPASRFGSQPPRVNAITEDDQDDEHQAEDDQPPAKDEA